MGKWKVSYANSAFKVDVYDSVYGNPRNSLSSEHASAYVNKWALGQNAMDLETAFGPKRNICSGESLGASLQYDNIVIQVRGVMVKALQEHASHSPSPGMR